MGKKEDKEVKKAEKMAKQEAKAAKNGVTLTATSIGEKAFEIRGKNPTISKVLFGANGKNVKKICIGNTVVYKSLRPIYENSNLTFNGYNYVDTGVNIWKYVDGTLGNKGFTIVVDFSTTQGWNSSNGPTIFHNMKEEWPYPGLVFDLFSEGGRLAGRDNQDNGIFTRVNDGNNKRLIVTCDGRNITYKAYTNGVLDKSANNYVLSWQDQCNSTSITQNLILGAFQQTNGSKGRYFNGRINSFKIFDKVLSNNEMNDID